MAVVVVHATLPSVRLGLAAMLADRGHQVVPEEQADESTVWVLDQPDRETLERLAAHRSRELPRAGVALADDAGLAATLAQTGLRGWACLGRDSGADELDLAVRAADAGLVLLDLPTAATAISLAPAAGSPSTRPGPDGPSLARGALSPRELQVLQLVAQGLPNKGIARALGISENTAKFHVASLSAKLGASGRTEAVTLAARQGLIVL